jgi:hypothetical protein
MLWCLIRLMRLLRVAFTEKAGKSRSFRAFFTLSLLTRILPLSLPLQSELRVRHREETKNVTRLTMENVSVLSPSMKSKASTLF